MKDIWLIQTTEPLPIRRDVRKMRTAFLAEKLIERGHNVVWWTSAFDHFKKEWICKVDREIELMNGLKIKTLKGIGYKRNVSIRRFIDYRIIAWKFKKIAPKMTKPDIIVTAMPHDIAYETVVYAKKNSVPILVDVRDAWPDVFLNHVHIRFRKLFKKILHNDFIMTKKTLQMADGLIAATSFFLEWGLSYAEREKIWKDKIFPLGYKKNETKLTSIEIKDKFGSLITVLENKFIIFFVGTISRLYHNPFIILDVAKKMAGYENIHFIIGGDGELFEEFKKQAMGYKNITLTRWLNGDEIDFILGYSKIGICPATKIVDLPTNKAFAYLSAGIPIISAFHGELKDIIEKYQIGFYYPPDDAVSLTDCIQKLYRDPVLHKKMAENAARVFEKFFDADKIYEEYAAHIEKIAFNKEELST